MFAKMIQNDVLLNALDNATSSEFKFSAGIVVINYKNNYSDYNSVTLYKTGIMSHICWDERGIFSEDVAITESQYFVFYQEILTTLLSKM